MGKVRMFFHKGKTATAKAIMFAGDLKSGEGNASHVGFLLDNGMTGEATFWGLRCQNFEHNYKNESVDIFDMPFLDECQHLRLECEILQQLGKFTGLYGYTKIPLQAADALISFVRRKPTYALTKAFAVDWFPICSSFVGRTLWKVARVELFCDWRYQSPDDQYDFVIKHPELFKRCNL
jgi:hypothetical protein